MNLHYFYDTFLKHQNNTHRYPNFFDKSEIFERTTLFSTIEKRNIDTIKVILLRKDIKINKKSVYFSSYCKIDDKTALYLDVDNDDLLLSKL